MNMKKVAMKTVSNNPQIITFFFEYDQNSWSMLKVGFWATTRTDITLGQAVASNIFTYTYRRGVTHGKHNNSHH